MGGASRGLRPHMRRSAASDPPTRAPRLAAFLAVLAPGGRGCGSAPATSTPPGSSPEEGTPALALAQPLPPAPTPATFDVADLAERVRPTVVNITPVRRISGRVVDNPFEFFFGPDGPRAPQERQGAG